MLRQAVQARAGTLLPLQGRDEFNQCPPLPAQRLQGSRVNT